MKVLGIILAEERGKHLGPLTRVRASAALPVFGKYRAIDFTLSNMVNAGISKIGIVTQYNPRSLMDHIGSGKEWDLDRKNGGVFILQPYYSPQNVSLGYKGTADSLFQNMNLFKRGHEDYALIGSGDHIYKIDYSQLFRKHFESGADITVLTGDPVIEYCDPSGKVDLINSGVGGRITDWKTRENISVEDLKNHSGVSLGVYFMNKYLLRELLYATVPEGETDLVEGIIKANVNSMNVVEHRFNGYWRNIKKNVQCYYSTNIDILDERTRHELFYEHGTVFTKLKDLPPPKVTGTATINNSVIADGSIISGKLDRSVIFRNSRIMAGATVKNSVILEGSIIEEGAIVENALLDKSCTIRSGRRLIGTPENPAVVEKHGVV